MRLVQGRRRIFLCWLIAGPLAGYFALAGYLYLNQRSLIFKPPADHGVETPADYRVPYEAVRIPVGSGQELAAWYLRHPDSEPGRLTVLYCHGNGAPLPRLSEVSSIFYGYGWNALLFDYRGYGESSPVVAQFSEELLAEDALAAYRWLERQDRNQNIFVWGHSLGSSVAARLARDVEPAGVVIEGAFPSLLSMAREHCGWIPIFAFMLRDRFATMDYLSESPVPKLFMHAEFDTIIPLALGQRTFDGSADSKRFILVRDVGHNDFPSVHPLYKSEIQEVVRGWFASRTSVKVLP